MIPFFLSPKLQNPGGFFKIRDKFQNPGDSQEIREGWQLCSDDHASQSHSQQYNGAMEGGKGVRNTTGNLTMKQTNTSRWWVDRMPSGFEA